MATAGICLPTARGDRPQRHRAGSPGDWWESVGAVEKTAGVTVPPAQRRRRNVGVSRNRPVGRPLYTSMTEPSSPDANPAEMRVTDRPLLAHTSGSTLPASCTERRER